jgi:hypothetical protein
LLAILLSSCSSSCSDQEDRKQRFAQYIQAFDKRFKEDTAKFSSGILRGAVAAVTVGKDACALGNNLNGLFAAVSALSTVSPEIMATEATVFQGLQAACAIIDMMPNGGEKAAEASIEAVASIQKLRENLARVDSTAEAASLSR